MAFFSGNKSLVADYGFNNLFPSRKTVNKLCIKAYGVKMAIGKKSDEWRKLESNVFKFEDEGEEITGILRSVEPSQMDGAKNKVYGIETSDGLLTVFGTVVLDSLMSGVKLGQMVRIAFTGERDNKNPAYSPIKQFDVFVK